MLTDAINSSTGTHIMYSYDAEKRLKTRVSNKDNIIHTFYYDGRDLVAEMANGKVIIAYTRGPGGVLLKENRTYSDTTGDCLVNYYYYPDRIGNVMLVCDDNGMPVEKETYDAFGKGMTKGISKCGMSSNMFDNDAGLYYFAARWYDGKTGRFVEMDPVVNDKTIINMYDYCGNNVLNVTDVYGENWFADVINKVVDFFTTGNSAKVEYDDCKDDNKTNSQDNDGNDSVAPISPGGVSVDQNIKNSDDSTIGAMVWIVKVLPYSVWDYKKHNIEYDEFGNFNYGATGTKVGFTENTLQAVAGFIQDKVAWFDTNIRGIKLKDVPKNAYGEKIYDEIMIEKGINYYAQCY